MASSDKKCDINKPIQWIKNTLSKVSLAGSRKDEQQRATEQADTSTDLEKTPDFRVAIIGAGIAGLTLAALLSKTGDIKVDVYESKDEVRTIGAAISLWRSYYNVLDKELSFAHAYAAVTGGPGMVKELLPSIYKADHGSQSSLLMAKSTHGFKPHGRPGVLEALVSRIDPKVCRMHTKRHLLNYGVKPSGEIELSFSGNELASCDLLIGADGLHSTVRRLIYAAQPIDVRSKFSGQYVYRIVYSTEEVEKDYPGHPILDGMKAWCASSTHMITIAIPPKLYVSIFVRAVTSESSREQEADLRSVPLSAFQTLFAPYNKDLQTLLKHQPLQDADGNFCSRWAVRTVPDLSSYVDFPPASYENSPAELPDATPTANTVAAAVASFKSPSAVGAVNDFTAEPSNNSRLNIDENPTEVRKSNVVLIGDAAHALLPHQGLGAGQGIEDAYVLYRLLTNPFTTHSKPGASSFQPASSPSQSPSHHPPTTNPYTTYHTEVAPAHLPNIQSALIAYDTICRPRAAAIADSSRIAGEMFDFLYPSHQRLLNNKGLHGLEKVAYELIGKEILAKTKDLSDDDGLCEKAVEEAVKLFERLVKQVEDGGRLGNSHDKGKGKANKDEAKSAERNEHNHVDEVVGTVRNVERTRLSSQEADDHTLHAITTSETLSSQTTTSPSNSDNREVVYSILPNNRTPDPEFIALKSWREDRYPFPTVPTTTTNSTSTTTTTENKPANSSTDLDTIDRESAKLTPRAVIESRQEDCVKEIAGEQEIGGKTAKARVVSGGSVRAEEGLVEDGKGMGMGGKGEDVGVKQEKKAAKRLSQWRNWNFGKRTGGGG